MIQDFWLKRGRKENGSTDFLAKLVNANLYRVLSKNINPGFFVIFEIGAVIFGKTLRKSHIYIHIYVYQFWFQTVQHYLESQENINLVSRIFWQKCNIEIITDVTNCSNILLHIITCRFVNLFKY